MRLPMLLLVLGGAVSARVPAKPLGFSASCSYCKEAARRIAVEAASGNRGDGRSGGTKRSSAGFRGRGGGDSRGAADIKKHLTASERLQKVMAHAGVASRRAAEAMIADGRVTVNGKLAADPGLRVNQAADKITVDGAVIKVRSQAEVKWVLLYKPKGAVTTTDDENGRKKVSAAPARPLSITRPISYSFFRCRDLHASLLHLYFISLPPYL